MNYFHKSPVTDGTLMESFVSHRISMEIYFPNLNFLSDICAWGSPTNLPIFLVIFDPSYINTVQLQRSLIDSLEYMKY